MSDRSSEQISAAEYTSKASSAKQVVWSKGMSKPCKQTSEWPGNVVKIHRYSEPRCIVPLRLALNLAFSVWVPLFPYLSNRNLANNLWAIFKSCPFILDAPFPFLSTWCMGSVKSMDLLWICPIFSYFPNASHNFRVTASYPRRVRLKPLAQI